MARGKRTTGGTARKTAKEPSQKGKKSTAPEKNIPWLQDHSLTDKLLSAIFDDPEIKQGLYSSVGGNASSSHGGGKTKSEHHWQLALAVFEDHPDYSASILSAKSNSKERSTWTTRIKNRLQVLDKTYAAHMQTMGETGAGIEHEDEIDLTQDNEFVNKWQQIQVSFPWLWLMKALVQERPNRVRKGLGNGNTDIDFDVIIPGSDANKSEPPESSDVSGRTSRLSSVSSHGDDDSSLGVTAADEELAGGADVDSVDHKAETLVGSKRPITSIGSESESEKAEKAAVKMQAKKTPARAGLTKPAKPSAKKPKIVEAMTDVAVAEEMTRQKEHDVQMKKIELAKAKVQAKLEIKQAREKRKAELAKLHAQQAHELAMERMRFHFGQTNPIPFNSMPMASSSHTGDFGFGGGNFGQGGLGGATGHANQDAFVGEHSNTQNF